jgi:SAM-dependent methyltransferase
MAISDEIMQHLHCPGCSNNLMKIGNSLICKNSECKLEFPIVNNIPIIIYEENSVFNIKDFAENKNTTFSPKKNILKEFLSALIPTISKNIKAQVNYKKFSEQLISFSSNPKVLVIGGSILGQGMESLLSYSSISLIESDVSFGPRTQIIFDAHNIPFPNEFFDGVIIQAVLEHVIDPYKCVQEIHRVLKRNGLVYAETPFIQQVHMGKYDFHRFTHLGHRLLFRNFSEIESGAVCGPGMALAWAYCYFFYSFFKSERIRKYLNIIVHFTSFYLKYFDYYLINSS